jgi:PAS domain S-box-containing protein
MARDVALAVAEGGELRTMLTRCREAAVKHLDAAFARIWTVDAAGTTLELQASAGMYTHVDGPHSRVPVGALKIGRIASSREPHITNDVQNDPWVGDPAWARREGMIGFAGYPLLVEGTVVGVMALFSRHALPTHMHEALASVANVVAVGIERHRTTARLAQIAAERERALAEAQVERGRLELVFDVAPASISIIQRNANGELVFTYANEISREQTGRADHIGRPIREVFPELEAQGFIALLDSLLASGQPLATKETPIHWMRNGERVDGWFNVTYQPLRDHAGNVDGLLSFAVDVTEQIRARQVLKRSEQRFRTLVEATAQIIWERNGRGEFEADQPAWRAFTGQTFDELRGWGWLNAIHPEDRERTRSEWLAALEAKRLYETEHRLRRADGEYRHMTVRAVPIFEDDGTLREWIGIHTDVAQRERLVRALERSNQELDQFAYVASHDLKAPLRGIANLSQWIEEDVGERLSGESRDQLRLLRGRVHRMESLIDGISAIRAPAACAKRSNPSTSASSCATSSSSWWRPATPASRSSARCS